MNVFEFAEETPDVNRKFFPAYDGEWLDYVAACRKGLPHEQYDVVEGGIADDNVFDTVDLYLQGIYTYEQALDFFYKSKTFELISEGVADMHCLSDEYLAEELIIEQDKQHS